MKQRLALTALFSLVVFNVSGDNEIELDEIQLGEGGIRNYLIERLPKEVGLVIFPGHPSPVQTIKWSSDNVHLATYSEFSGRGDVTKNFVRIWNSKTGALINGIGSGEEIKDFAWAPDGKRIAITHHTNKVWVADLSEVYELEQKMAKLSPDDLSFMALFYGEKPLTKLTKEQQKKLNKFPAVIKKSLTEQLDDYNWLGEQPDPLR